VNVVTKGWDVFLEFGSGWTVCQWDNSPLTAPEPDGAGWAWSDIQGMWLRRAAMLDVPERADREEARACARTAGFQVTESDRA
jgi:hypothetical protein